MRQDVQRALNRFGPEGGRDQRGGGGVSNSRLKATLNEAPDASDGPCVRLVFPPVDEGDEASRVQAALRSDPPVARAGLQPRFLEAEPSRGSPAGVGAEEQAHEVPGRLADPLEVVPGEAEVQPADVQAGFLRALVQEGGGAAQQHVGHHAETPQVRGQRHGISQDQLWGGELGAAQERVDVVGAVQLHGVTEVCDFDCRLAAGAVGDQQVLRLQGERRQTKSTINACRPKTTNRPEGAGVPGPRGNYSEPQRTHCQENIIAGADGVWSSWNSPENWRIVIQIRTQSALKPDLWPKLDGK